MCSCNLFAMLMQIMKTSNNVYLVHLCRERSRIVMDANVVTILIFFLLLQTSLSRPVHEATKEFQFYKDSDAVYSGCVQHLGN